MKKAIVTFVQYYTYEVEISDEIYNNRDRWEATKIAEEDFISDMRSNVRTTYDDIVEIEFEEEEEE